MSDLAEIIVFGGTFDPPHAGHLAMALAALARFPKSEVCVLPAAHPAVARGDTKEVVASFSDRVAMCQIAFHGGDGRLCTLFEEEKLPAPNYTVNTLRHMARLFPGKKLGLLLGADQLAQFHAWHRPDEIQHQAMLIVAPRQGVTAPRDIPHVTLDRDPGPAASRLIRAAYAKGEAVPAGWLNPGVQTYIRDHHLYAPRGP